MKGLKIVTASILLLAACFGLLSAADNSRSKANVKFIRLPDGNLSKVQVDYIKDLEPNQYKFKEINGKKVMVVRREVN